MGIHCQDGLGITCGDIMGILSFDWLKSVRTKHTSGDRNIEVILTCVVTNQTDIDLSKLRGGAWRSKPSKVFVVIDAEKYFERVSDKDMAHFRLLLGENYPKLRELLTELGVFGEIEDT